MEEGKGPPPETAVTTDVQATPYPGAPLYQNMVDQPVSQPAVLQYVQPGQTSYPGPPVYHNVHAPQPAAQHCDQPVPQLVAEKMKPGFGKKGQKGQPGDHVIVMQSMPTDLPGRMQCPHCQNTVVTSTEYKVGMCTWITAGLLFLFLCWPCCFIPFCVPSCKDVEHSCPSCRNVLHTYKRR